MSGYPDWQSSSQARSASLIAQGAFTFPAGDNQVFAGPVASWPSLQLRAQPSSGGGYWQVTWYADAAFTISMGTDRWQCNGSTLASVITPCQAPFAVLVFHSTSGTGVTGIFYAAFTTIPTVGDLYPVTACTFGIFNKSLPLSQNDKYQPRTLIRGTGMLCFEPADTTGKLQCIVYACDEVGTFLYRIADIPAATAPVMQPIAVPDSCWQVEVLNNDATGAHSYSLGVVIPGI